MIKWIFGIIGIICFTVLQISAWIFGYVDQQIFIFTTSGISAILSFLTGVNLADQVYERKLYYYKIHKN